jgi:hypothetical protein
MMTAEWHGMENIDVMVEARTGQVLTVEAPARGAGRP